MDSWTDMMTARDRIEAIAVTLGQPRSVNWIKEQADVGSWDTTKSHLDRLVDAGRLTTTEVSGDTRYMANPVRAYLDHLEDLVANNTKDSLRDELEAIAEEIETWKQEYDVESLDELEASLGEDFTPEELRDRRKIVAHWEENEQYRRLITNALHLYDDLAAQAQAVPDDRLQHAD